MTQTLTQKMKNDLGINTLSTQMVAHGSRLLDLETRGSGSVWFDAWRISNVEASSWTKITYSNVRESNAGAMDVGTGVFTAPLAGTYQFIIQAYKYSGVDGRVKIVVDGTRIDGTTVSDITDRDTPNEATLT